MILLEPCSCGHTPSTSRNTSLLDWLSGRKHEYTTGCCKTDGLYISETRDDSIKKWNGAHKPSLGSRYRTDSLEYCDKYLDKKRQEVHKLALEIAANNNRVATTVEDMNEAINRIERT